MNLSSRHVLVHYSEIALKGRNRGYFEKLLVESLHVGLRGFGIRSIRRMSGRILVEFDEPVTTPQISERFDAMLGISHFELAMKVEQDLEALRAALDTALQDVEASTFAIVTRRSNKDFPLNSVAINRDLGTHVVESKGWSVSLDDPELPIYIYIVEDAAFVAFHRLPGRGGMPFGTAGHVGVLLSGGIDSPVAAYRMMRRGCQPVFIHFHSAPYTDQASQDKVQDLAEHLMRHKKSSPLYLVPFAELQQRIVAQTRAAYRVILYRRFMMRTAEVLARKHGARALVTGEALGQVASQTLENLATIDAVCRLPVLRPLIGHDKLDIVREAESIGTFETSIEPHDDCCSYLMPQQPATRSNVEQLEEAEAVFDVEAEVQALAGQATLVRVGIPSRKRRD